MTVEFPKIDNPYTTGRQKIIPAVLLYAFFEDQVLMLHRNQKSDDPHWGKWNGLGGKLELGETIREASSREFEEEAGLKVAPSRWQWQGQLFFPNFRAEKNQDWWVSILTTQLNQSEARSHFSKNPEGTLHWVPLPKVLTLNLWEGDPHFLPLVFEKKKFEGTFFYVNGKCTRYELIDVSI